MYGTRRVTLSSKSLVAVTGNRSNFTIGRWYNEDGKLYADLISMEQKYRGVSFANIANKRLGGVATKTELRNLIATFAATELGLAA